MQHCMTKASAAGTQSRPVTTVYHTTVTVPEGYNTGTKLHICILQFEDDDDFILDLSANYFPISLIQHMIYSVKSHIDL